MHSKPGSITCGVHALANYLSAGPKVFSYVNEMIMVPTFQRCCEY